MEIGVCTAMNATPADPAGMESIRLYRDAGFDYVELPGSALAFLTSDKLRSLEKELSATGMSCPAVSTLFHPSVKVTGEKVDRSAVDKYINDVFTVMAALGVETVVFGSSHARNVPMRFPMEKAWDQLEDLLRRLGDRAAKDGIIVVIEHINRLESNVIETFEEGVLMCGRVDHPAVCCLVDHYHMALGREPMGPVIEHINLVKHAHFANVLARSIPTEDRHEQDGLRFLEELQKTGYSGRISVEGFAESMGEFPGCAQFMRGRVWQTSTT